MAQSLKFGARPDGSVVSAYELSSETGFRAVILDQGAVLQSLCLPDGQNITLGFADWAGYESDTNYIGRIIGPNANRISNACFRIDGNQFQVTPNDGPNNLHSGPDGFHVQKWDVKTTASGLSLTLDTPDGQGGFPGAIKTQLHISLVENRLKLDIEAQSDHPTPLNMTWHPYWNLGKTLKIDGHDLFIDAQSITEFETGMSHQIKDTRHDFERARPIGSVQLDSNYKDVRQVVLSTDKLSMTVTSSLPDMQVYTGDALPSPRSGIAIEPQFQPNDVNLAQNSVLRAGETYKHWIEYRFDVS